MTPEEAKLYLSGKYRTYDERAVRYRLAAYAMILMGLQDEHSLLDIGGGDAEMEKCLREEFGWKGFYNNIDHTTGRDISEVTRQSPGYWEHDFVTCLEVVEHFPFAEATRLLNVLPDFSRIGTVFSTPNPYVQDVRAMDPTHITGIAPGYFTRRGYTVERHMLYDGYYSEGQVDGLIAYKEGNHA